MGDVSSTLGRVEDPVGDLVLQPLEDSPPASGSVVVAFEVLGCPVPQGSGRPVRAGNGRLRVLHDRPGLGPWRQAVAWQARRALGVRGPLSGAVAVELEFTFVRPRGHFGRRGLRPTAPPHHSVRPDLDKLVRAVLDGLRAAGVLGDDAQVAELRASKAYGDQPGLKASVRALEGSTERRSPLAVVAAGDQ